jgi:predicted alpha/beta hydrolase
MASERTEFERWCRERGWTCGKSKGGHLRLTHPAVKVPVFASLTPSDPNAYANARAFIRRMERQAAMARASISP